MHWRWNDDDGQAAARCTDRHKLGDLWRRRVVARRNHACRCGLGYRISRRTASEDGGLGMQPRPPFERSRRAEAVGHGGA